MFSIMHTFNYQSGIRNQQSYKTPVRKVIPNVTSIESKLDYVCWKQIKITNYNALWLSFTERLCTPLWNMQV